jgi:hypothetical protein
MKRTGRGSPSCPEFSNKSPAWLCGAFSSEIGMTKAAVLPSSVHYDDEGTPYAPVKQARSNEKI